MKSCLRAVVQFYFFSIIEKIHLIDLGCVDADRSHAYWKLVAAHSTVALSYDSHLPDIKHVLETRLLEIGPGNSFSNCKCILGNQEYVNPHPDMVCVCRTCQLPADP